MTEQLLIEPLTPTDLAPREHNPWAMIDRSLASGMSPPDLSELYALARQWNQDEAAKAFGVAVTKFQSLCPVIHKGRKAAASGNFAGYSFASYDDIMKAIQPILETCELAISFSSESLEHSIKITCRVRHGVHYEDHTMTVPVPKMPINDTQRYGAALSYAKRYCLTGALNIVVSDEDDDAAALHEAITAAQAKELEELLMSANADIAKFCQAYQIDAIGNLPASQLAQARAQILRKIEAAKNANR